MGYRTRDRKAQRKNPLKSSRIEREYAGQLRQIARMVGSICGGFDPDLPDSASSVVAALQLYSEAVSGWAATTAGRMIEDIAKADARAWRERSDLIGRELRREMAQAPTGKLYARLMREQVELIQSLPISAAERVHELVSQGVTQGRRAGDLAGEIHALGDITASRATLIARTETSRAASNLTQARAEYAGSTHYIWRTSGDSDVRPGHRAMNGQAFRWDDPPEVDEGGRVYRTHPGGIFNCRCYAEPIFPD